MRKIFATVAVVTLAVTGCGTSDDGEAPVTGTTAATNVEQNNGLIDLELGEAAHLNTDGKNHRNVKVTVTDVQVFDTCPEGKLESVPTDRDSGVYLLVKWDTDVRESRTDYMATEWGGIGAGDTLLETENAEECLQPDGVKPPGPVLTDTNASEGRVFWSADKPTRWFLNEPWEPNAFAWPVPEEITHASQPAESDAGEAPPAETEEIGMPETSVAVPDFVRCATHGGSALMSDGSVIYSESCDERVGASDGYLYGDPPAPQEEYVVPITPSNAGTPNDPVN